MIKVSSLSKSYKSYNSNVSRVLHYMGLGTKPRQLTHILKNISFEIKAGECVGIIGQNGAGKSTLLKIITGTLGKSSGKVEVNGKICAILELGMGFIPDLSGRANVYQTASVFGHSRAQIDEKIKEIEDFAEIGEYFDKPVRLYSSGMQVRLAFAVATAWRPDILIVDEALSVGDAYFQNKSFSRIRQMKELGTTLLLVSHDLSAIISVCNRALLIEKGELIKDDEPSAVLDYYNALISQKEGVEISQEKKETGEVATISGNKKAVIQKAYILNEKLEKTEKLFCGEKIKIAFEVFANEDIDDLVIGFMIRTKHGVEVYGANTSYMKIPLSIKKAEKKLLSYSFDLNIGENIYSLSASLHSTLGHIDQNYFWQENILAFEVINSKYHKFVGTTYLKLKFQEEILANAKL